MMLSAIKLTYVLVAIFEYSQGVTSVAIDVGPKETCDRQVSEMLKEHHALTAFCVVREGKRDD